MSSLESGFCSWQEYAAWEERRLMERDLAIEGLYMLMFAVRGEGKSPAAKFPARLLALDEVENDRYGLGIQILNIDVEDLAVQATFVNGYWQQHDSSEVIIGETHQVTTGYFKEKYRPFGGGLDAEDLIDLWRREEMDSHTVLPKVPTMV